MMREEEDRRQEQSVPDSQSVTAHPVADWMFLQPAILDLMHDSVIITDMQGIITGCNEAARRIFGYRAEELRGKSVSMLYPEDDESLQRVIGAVQADGEFKGEIRNRTSSGDYIYIHLTVTQLRDGDGHPVGMVGFSVDVTGQKLGQMALKEREEMEKELQQHKEASSFLDTLKRAVERSSDVIMITEAEPVEEPGPVIVYVNEAFEHHTGYKAEEVLGKNPRFLQGPKTDRAALDRIRRAIKAWEPCREELINYRKDGSEFTVEFSIVPVADETGWYTHWFSIQRDTSEQYQLRQRLAEREAWQRGLMEALPQFVWTSDADGRRDWVNHAFAEFGGADVKDLLGDGWIRYVHPEDRDLALTRLQADRQMRRMSQVEIRLRQKDGKYLWFLKQAIPQFGADGNVEKWTGSFTNISER